VVDRDSPVIVIRANKGVESNPSPAALFRCVFRGHKVFSVGGGRLPAGMPHPPAFGEEKMRIATLISLIALLLVSCDQKHAPQESATESQPMKITYLKKANDDVISFCSCGDGRVTFPAQMDCPWCGSGWLFTCVTCRKAFTFAEGVEIEGTWEDIAREDIRNKWKEEPSEDDVGSWIEAMKEILSDVRAGAHYVIIDGAVIPADASKVTFDGWHAHHEFESLPQVDAQTDKSVLDSKLSNREYWTSNALPEN